MPNVWRGPSGFFGDKNALGELRFSFVYFYFELPLSRLYWPLLPAFSISGTNITTKWLVGLFFFFLNRSADRKTAVLSCLHTAGGNCASVCVCVCVSCASCSQWHRGDFCRSPTAASVCCLNMFWHKTHHSSSQCPSAAWCMLASASCHVLGQALLSVL